MPLFPLVCSMIRPPPTSTLFPYTTLFRSLNDGSAWVTTVAAPEKFLAHHAGREGRGERPVRSEEHTSELQSLRHLVCRLLLEKKSRIAPCIHVVSDLFTSDAPYAVRRALR